LGIGQPRAVLTLYVTAAGLGLAALFITRAPVPVANVAFAGLLIAGGLALLVFERIEPRLSGDPTLVLLPGGGGLVEAVRVASRLSREVVLLLAPAYMADGTVRPTRQEMIEAVATLAEHPAAVRALLEGGLSEAWWLNVNELNQALKLNGTVWAVTAEPAPALPEPSAEWQLPGAAQPVVTTALTKARLILLGPGDPSINLAPALGVPGIREGVLGTRGAFLWVGAEGGQTTVAAWLGESVSATPPHHWESDVQARLLNQAAKQAKSQPGRSSAG
jgi:hypothetical protein